MNQSIHHIDALQWLMGEVESVFAYTATLAHDMEAEDAGVVSLRFKNGALATIEGSTLTYPENLEGSIALFGEHGSVKVGGTALNRKIFWKIAGQIEHEREILTQEIIDPPSVYGTSHRDQIAEMLTAIRQQRPPSTDGKEARKSLELVCAIYESARISYAILMLNLAILTSKRQIPAQTCRATVSLLAILIVSATNFPSLWRTFRFLSNFLPR